PLLHQADQILVRIANEGDPELVVAHSGRELRIAFAPGAASDDGLVDGIEVVDLEVQDGVGPGAACALRRREHDAHVAGLEEGELGPGFEEKLEPQNVSVEGERGAQVANRERDLTDWTNPDV